MASAKQEASRYGGETGDDAGDEARHRDRTSGVMGPRKDLVPGLSRQAAPAAGRGLGYGVRTGSSDLVALYSTALTARMKPVPLTTMMSYDNFSPC